MLKVQQILMEWAFKSKEYYMAYILYTEYGIGIPNKFLYGLESKIYFSSVSDFISNSDVKYIDNEYLEKIFNTFKYSKYTKLQEWNNSYGYKFIQLM